MPAFKPAYLIHGDDHGRVGERRARLKAVAEAQFGAGGVESFDGDEATPASIALALSAMTFAIGRRFLIVDGVERWKDADVTAELAPALADPPPDTTVAFFAREDGRAQAPAALHKLVVKAGGDVAAEKVRKVKELPRWAMEQARQLGIELDIGGAQALVAIVGERQQRILRELETLALEHGAGASLGAEEVEASAAASSERQAWSLADAIVAADRRAATAVYGELRGQGEDPARLIPLMARRVREVLAIAERLEHGAAPAEIKASMKGNPYAIDRRIREARGADLWTLRGALEAIADLELATRGGSELAADTAALRAIARATG